MAEIVTGNWKIEIEAANNPTFSNDCMIELLKLLSILHASAGMEKLDFTKRTDGKYDYEFKSLDGRKWVQILDVTNPTDYTMTFDTAGGWRLSEFLPHWPLQSQVIKMSHELQLEWIKVRFIV